MLDDIDLDISEKKPKGSGNQGFRMIAGILGVILLLAVIAAAVYAFIILPGQSPVDLPQGAVDTALTETAEALDKQTEPAVEEAAASPSPSATRTATSRPSTQVPTATEITPIFTAAVNGQTATVHALLTRAALSQTEAAGGSVAATATSTPSSTLPESGFADDAGLPTLIISTALLLAVILVARRMRTVER